MNKVLFDTRIVARWSQLHGAGFAFGHVFGFFFGRSVLAPAEALALPVGAGLNSTTQ